MRSARLAYRSLLGGLGLNGRFGDGLRPGNGFGRHAFGAAAVLADVFVEVLLAIVVGAFLSRPDLLQRQNIDPVLVHVRLAVGYAGVIDVPRLVPARRSVEHLLLADVEEVAGTGPL